MSHSKYSPMEAGHSNDGFTQVSTKTRRNKNVSGFKKPDLKQGIINYCKINSLNFEPIIEIIDQLNDKMEILSIIIQSIPVCIYKLRGYCAKGVSGGTCKEYHPHQSLIDALNKSLKDGKYEEYCHPLRELISSLARKKLAMLKKNQRKFMDENGVYGDSDFELELIDEKNHHYRCQCPHHTQQGYVSFNGKRSPCACTAPKNGKKCIFDHAPCWEEKALKNPRQFLMDFKNGEIQQYCPTGNCFNFDYINIECMKPETIKLIKPILDYYFNNGELDFEIEIEIEIEEPVREVKEPESPIFSDNEAFPPLSYQKKKKPVVVERPIQEVEEPIQEVEEPVKKTVFEVAFKKRNSVSSWADLSQSDDELDEQQHDYSCEVEEIEVLPPIVVKNVDKPEEMIPVVKNLIESVKQKDTQIKNDKKDVQKSVLDPNVIDFIRLAKELRSTYSEEDFQNIIKLVS